MPRTTRSSARQPAPTPAPRPLPTRLPANVLTLIFIHASEWWDRARALPALSLVHSAWRGPAQELMCSEMSVFGAKRARSMLGPSSRVGTVPAKRLYLHSGRGEGKVDVNLAGQVLDRVGSLESVTIMSVHGLTGNDLFARTQLWTRLTHFEINMAIKDLPKSATPLACPATIPLRTIKLGTQTVSSPFLSDLFTASRTTLVHLHAALNPRTAASLSAAFPLAAPHLAQLTLEAHPASPAERAFFPLLSRCTSLRAFGWVFADFASLGLATDCLPDRGGRVERLTISCGAPSLVPGRVTAVLGRAGLCGLREVRVRTFFSAERNRARLEGTRRVGLERRVLVHFDG